MDSIDPQMENDQIPMESRMDVSDGDEVEDVVTIDSDDESSNEDDDDIIHVPSKNGAGFSSTRQRTTGVKSQPDVIDLTKDEENDIDEIMITENSHQDDSSVIVEDDVPELIEVDPVPKKDIAEDSKNKGNNFFKLGNYYQALGMYTQAIEAMPSEASYYGNRSACNMMLKRYKEALADIRTSLQLDPTYEKGHLRLIRTTLALGNIKECELAFDTMKKLGIQLDVKTEQDKLIWLKKQKIDIDATKVKKEYRKLVFLASQGLEIASADNDLKMLKADALVRLGRHTEAQELCTEVLQNDLRCAEALYIRAMCLYLDDNQDKSIQFVRQGLQYAPDNSSFQTLYKKIKQVKELRESGSSKFSLGRYDEAKSDYMQCLLIVTGGDMDNITIQSKLHFNIALITLKQNKLDESLAACSKAIELNSKYLKAIIHRAKVYVQKEMYDDAVHDYEAALRIDPTLRQLKRELQETKTAAKRAKRKDYYKILNVDKSATEDEIKKAYKKRALLHHPDRHASATDEVKKEQERLFKDLGEAYEVLSDSKKRFRYDQGVDLMDEGGFGGGGYADPSNDFINVFFGNGGIPSFRPGQGAGGGGRGPHQFHHTFRH